MVVVPILISAVKGWNPLYSTFLLDEMRYIINAICQFFGVAEFSYEKPSSQTLLPREKGFKLRFPLPRGEG